MELEAGVKRDGFQYPMEEYSPIPFWFWNDELDRNEIDRQMRAMKEKGVDAFVIHPRIGLPEHMEYMSKEFLDYVEFAVEQATELEMKVVLYDEGMYPSGSANGGVVCSNPIFASVGLAMYSEPQENGILIFQDTVHYFYLEKSGGTIRGIHYGEDDGEIHAPKSADLLNRNAVAKFIELTHEKYYKRLSKYFGNTIVAMFTDEPDVLGRNARPGLIPWTYDFLSYYEKEGGNKKDLPKLFSDEDSREKRIYQEIIHKKLSESYYEPLKEWCESHNIAFTGHPQKSDDIGLLSHFTIPCQDIVWRFIAPKDDSGTVGVHSTMGKCSSDSARHRRKRRNGNECFGCCSLPETPYDFSKEDMKWYLDWLFIRGVNLVYPHAFFYSITDQRKAERPPDVGMHSSFWNDYHAISDYIKRMCYLMTDSVNQAKVAILCTGDRLSDRVAKPLFENQIEFNYLEEDLLEACQISEKESKVCLADQAYELIILDGKYKENSERILRSWENKGIKIMQVSEENLQKLAELVKEQVSTDIITQTPCPKLRMSHLKKDGMDLLVFTNEGEKTIHTTLSIQIGRVTEIWDAETGEKEVLDQPLSEIVFHLGYRKSTIYVISNSYQSE